MNEFKPVFRNLPENNQVVDWITPDGRQVSNGRYFRGLWFLPPGHQTCSYYRPLSWRPAEEPKPKEEP